MLKRTRPKEGPERENYDSGPTGRFACYTIHLLLRHYTVISEFVMRLNPTTDTCYLNRLYADSPPPPFSTFFFLRLLLSVSFFPFLSILFFSFCIFQTILLRHKTTLHPYLLLISFILVLSPRFPRKIPSALSRPSLSDQIHIQQVNYLPGLHPSSSSSKQQNKAFSSHDAPCPSS